MLDAPNSVFDAAINVRQPLRTVNNGLDYSGVALTALTVADVSRFSYMLYLQAACIVAGTAQGDWTITDTTGTIILVLRQSFDTPSPGAEFCWPAPHPWKTAAIGDAFFIQGSNANMGTWRFIANGFRSRT